MVSAKPSRRLKRIRRPVASPRRWAAFMLVVQDEAAAEFDAAIKMRPVRRLNQIEGKKKATEALAGRTSNVKRAEGSQQGQVQEKQSRRRFRR